MHIIRMLIVGLIVGGIAAFLYPHNQHLGFIGLTAVGIGGSFVGGFITHLISPPKAGSSQALHPAGFIMSIVGALVLIFGLRLVHLL